ncbi:MAG TPA: MBL fold metallo-hydrolase [bacterium]|jgi:L-ascorbate metabolism protein UlaG (beta-lactamase superfamily)
MAVTLEWLGHSCFRLTSESGTRILIDPFDDSIGYKVPPYECEILLLSHNHYDSCARHLVKKGCQIIDRKGTHQAGDLIIKAHPAWHDKLKGKDYGEVLIFSFELDGLKWAYFSHIGSLPRDWVFEEIGDIDVAFIPVGGVFALGPHEAKLLVDRIKPKLVVPMHFDTLSLSFTLLPLDEFKRLMKNIWREEWHVVTINPGGLSDETVMLHMNYWSD